MRSLLLAGSLVATLALPTLASAQTRCERDQSTNRAAGTVIGAGIGALFGGAIAGRKSTTEGVVIGGIAGAIAGNQVTKNVGEPCPQGYYETQTSAPVAYGGSTWFWSGAPSDMRQRIDYMRERIGDSARDGSLSRDEADRAYADLRDVRQMEETLRERDRGLTYDDSQYLQARLDTVGEQVRWGQRMQAYNQTPYGYSSEVTTSTEVNPRSYGSTTYYDQYTPPAAESVTGSPYARGYYDSQGYWHADQNVGASPDARGYYDSQGNWRAQ
jgi:hypothetical protein